MKFIQDKDAIKAHWQETKCGIEDRISQFGAYKTVHLNRSRGISQSTST